MKISMFTNTYLPHVGGVARSVNTYEEELRQRGHAVRIIAPEFPDAEESTEHVLRVPAIQNFNGSDFSVRLPLPGLISADLDEFQPELIHSHHPFLLGDAALRSAYERHLPLVFTHHTMYEQYTHYVPLDSDAMKRVAIQMATDYCNLCTHVIAPSESVKRLLEKRGVEKPISAIPTGIDLEFFASGDRNRFRSRFDLPQDAMVIGHVGRLAAEKNLEYLANAVSIYLKEHEEARFLIVGDGDYRESMHQRLLQHVDQRQIVFAGKQCGPDLADAYAAMDLFAFSSKSETQGMVLAEAMAAGLPTVALDAPGVREVVHEINGQLLPGDATEQEFAAAMTTLTEETERLWRIGEAARESVQSFGLKACADRLTQLYGELIDDFSNGRDDDFTPWDSLLARLEIEWELLVGKTAALAAAVIDTDATEAELV